MPETGKIRRRWFPRQLLLPLNLLCLAAFLCICAALYHAAEIYQLPCSTGDAMTAVVDNLPFNGVNLTNSTDLMQYLNDPAQRQQFLNALKDVTACSKQMVQMQMSFSDGLYLAMTLATGVGYGVIIPRTVGGKWIAIFNAYIGLTLSLSCYMLLGKIMWNSARQLLDHHYCNVHKWVKFVMKMIILVVVGHVIFMFIPCAIVMTIEVPNDWTYLDTYYCLLTTIASIGLGDFMPAETVTAPWVEVYRIGLYCYFILGCAYIVAIIRAFVEELDHKGPVIEQKIIHMARSISSIHLPHHSNSHASQSSTIPAEGSTENHTPPKMGSSLEVLNASTLSLGGHHHHLNTHPVSGDVHEEKQPGGLRIETGYLTPQHSTKRRRH